MNPRVLLAVLGGVLAWMFMTKGGQSVRSSASSAVATGAERIIDAGQSVITNMTRGERNNNPGNIRLTSAAWVGKLPSDQQTDSAFVRFDSAENGVRALTVLLRNYSRQGYRTVAQIIGRYAPPNENATFAYASQVARALGVATNVPLDLNDRDTLFRLVRAIIAHENGRVSYSDAQITAGIDRA